MTIFLTFNDAPSGIYASQVIDVVSFLREKSGTKIRLVAFISLRGFFLNRKKIRTRLSDAMVLPMYPRLSNWRKNRFLLKIICSLFSVDRIIARSVIATNLALSVKSTNTKVIYDGRGAIAAEWQEYKVVTDHHLLNQISFLEDTALKQSDAQLAVSQKLKDYWLKEYQHAGQNTVVIPCTINAVFENLTFTEEAVRKARTVLGYNEEDLVFVYSGSVAGWQSFQVLEDFALPLLGQSPATKFLFLSAQDSKLQIMQTRFPDQVQIKQCGPEEVPAYLLASDYGLLIREESITNAVASPVKFAEYLACGLPVIISDNLGDYSRFVIDKECGYAFNRKGTFVKPDLKSKAKYQQLALENFTKHAFVPQYAELLKLHDY